MRPRRPLISSTLFAVRPCGREGYISGETWVNHYDPSRIAVVSTWQSVEDWIHWEESEQRTANEAKLEGLLKTPVKFEIYDLGVFPPEP